METKQFTKFEELKINEDFDAEIIRWRKVLLKNLVQLGVKISENDFEKRTIVIKTNGEQHVNRLTVQWISRTTLDYFVEIFSASDDSWNIAQNQRSITTNTWNEKFIGITELLNS